MHIVKQHNIIDHESTYLKCDASKGIYVAVHRDRRLFVAKCVQLWGSPPDGATYTRAEGRHRGELEVSG